MKVFEKYFLPLTYKPRELPFDGVIFEIYAKDFLPFIDKPRKKANTAIKLENFFPLLVGHENYKSPPSSNFYFLSPKSLWKSKNWRVWQKWFIFLLGSSRKRHFLTPFFEICLENKKSTPRKERIKIKNDSQKILTIIDINVRETTWKNLPKIV